MSDEDLFKYMTLLDTAIWQINRIDLKYKRGAYKIAETTKVLAYSKRALEASAYIVDELVRCRKVLALLDGPDTPTSTP